jgi:hypothetical protein
VPVENTSTNVVESAPAEESSLAPAPSSTEAVSAEDDAAVEQVQPAETTAEATESVVAASRWVAENVALTAEEASLELEREMNQVQAVSEAPAQPALEPALETQSETPTESPVAIPEETKGATFAAAASASSSATMAVATSETEAEPVPSEASAAWENWQHIRDSVMGSQSAVAESVAKVAETSISAQSPENNLAADPDAESAELSSIVDSVLAELKPRLMAEISKKLKK